MTSLPSARDLEKLPLRAVLAYATRAARRASVDLRMAVEEGAFEEALSIAESVTSAELLTQLDPAASELAAARAIGILVALRRPGSALAVLSIADAAGAASNAIMAAAVQKHARMFAASAARAAAKAASYFDALEGRLMAVATEAACRDYRVLLETFGEHEMVVIGDPIDLCESSLLGPVWPVEERGS